MRIGLFTDTYHPSTNGVVFVIDITRKHLEAMGHEVYIFCPGSLRGNPKDDDHIVHFPSVKGAFYDDYNLSLFFPPRIVKKINELKLDIIHSFTPGQVGLMAVYAGNKHGIPVVAQHSTDVYQYVEHYPAVLPGLLVLALMLPLSFRFDGKDAKELLKLYIPRRGVHKWNRAIIEALIAMVYSRSTMVIALSRKSYSQLSEWRTSTGYWYDLTLMPTGVDALPRVSKKELEDFRHHYDIDAKDILITYVGRLGAEKNLASLIKVIEKVHAVKPHARLLYVGDFEYRKELESLAQKSPAHDRITFTGILPRHSLNRVYENTAVFVFPSMTDTQGLVLHEAAHAGCPIVAVDGDLSEVLVHEKNGYVSKNTPGALSQHIIDILNHPKQAEHFRKTSQKFARKYTEKRQINQLVILYKSTMKRHNHSPKKHWVRRLLSR